MGPTRSPSSFTRLALSLVVGLAGALGAVGATGCKKATDVELWVAGFQPENVHFEVEDLGTLGPEELREVTRRPDVDGSLLLPAGSCQGPQGACHVALVSVFVRNKDDAQAPPVIRLKSPPGRPDRLPIAFRGDEISRGRVGRIRWVVEMWPEEERLTATLSSSVFLVDSPAPRPTPAPTPLPPAPQGPATPDPSTQR